MISPVLIIRAKSGTSPMLTWMPLLPNPVVIRVMSQIQISMIYKRPSMEGLCRSYMVFRSYQPGNLSDEKESSKLGGLRV